MNSNTHNSRPPLRLLQNALIAILCLNLCGCLSTAVVETARSRRFVDENGEVMKIEKGETGLYWLLPLTVPIDAITFVFWAALEGMGSDSDYSSSGKKPEKLHLSR